MLNSIKWLKTAGLLSVLFSGETWFEKCKLRLLPVTEQKIKDFAYSFLKSSHLLSVSEEEDSAVLIRAVFFSYT